MATLMVHTNFKLLATHVTHHTTEKATETLCSLSSQCALQAHGDLAIHHLVRGWGPPQYTCLLLPIEKKNVCLQHLVSYCAQSSQVREDRELEVISGSLHIP